MKTNQQQQNVMTVSGLKRNPNTQKGQKNGYLIRANFRSKPLSQARKQHLKNT